MFKKTPAETWFEEMKSGNKDPGEIPLSQNLSNLIILAVLNKYGGIYLDTDFIVLKSFAGLRNANWSTKYWCVQELDKIEQCSSSL